MADGRCKDIHPRCHSVFDIHTYHEMAGKIDAKTLTAAPKPLISRCAVQENSMVAQSDHPAHPFDAITAKFNRPDASSESEGGSAHDTATQSIASVISAPPLVLPEDITSPAIILSREMRIIWQNPSAVSRLWHHETAEMIDGHQMDIFDIVLSSHFQNQVRNWRQWTAFFIQQALAMMQKEALEKLIAEKEDRQSEILQAMLTDFEPASEHPTFSGNLQQLMHQERCITYHVIGISFEIGRLLVFETLNDGDKGELSNVQSLAYAPPSILMRTYKRPLKIPIYVLCARLNNADTIASEILAKDYGRLLNRLWGLAKITIEQHAGLFIQNEPGAMIGYFISPEKAEQKPLNIIQCALALKNQMNDLGREWKIQMSWLHDIELNIGIHSSTEYITSLPSSLGDSLLALGNTLPLANRLSALSQAGQIWTTKTVVDQIPDDEIETLRFGIFRNEHQRQIFIPNSFMKIGELSSAEQTASLEKDEFSVMPVTLVFDYQAQTQIP